MRISTAIALAAMSVLLVAGCGKKKSTPASKTTKTSKASKTTKPRTRRSRNTKGTDIRTPAPSSFSIKPLDAAGREKRAETACKKIAADRKKRLEGLVHVLSTVPDRTARH
jgi:basic membrane lipoprotein Med (substrate-binding protein (PBP1-ABC) superfamily)